MLAELPSSHAARNLAFFLTKPAVLARSRSAMISAYLVRGGSGTAPVSKPTTWAHPTARVHHQLALAGYANIIVGAGG